LRYKRRSPCRFAGRITICSQVSSKSHDPNPRIFDEVRVRSDKTDRVVDQVSGFLSCRHILRGHHAHRCSRESLSVCGRNGHAEWGPRSGSHPTAYETNKIIKGLSIRFREIRNSRFADRAGVPHRLYIPTRLFETSESPTFEATSLIKTRIVSHYLIDHTTAGNCL